jgi:hypothetical protein
VGHRCNVEVPHLVVSEMSCNGGGVSNWDKQCLKQSIVSNQRQRLQCPPCYKPLKYL